MDIGEILSNARQSAGLTQEQVAEHFHVSRQTISNWENCKTYPDILMSIELSKLYGIDLTSLLEDTTGPSEYAKHSSQHLGNSGFSQRKDDAEACERTGRR